MDHRHLQRTDSVPHAYLCTVICNDCSRRSAFRNANKAPRVGEVGLVGAGSERSLENADGYSSCLRYGLIATENVNGEVSFWQKSGASFVGQYEELVRLVTVLLKLQLKSPVAK